MLFSLFLFDHCTTASNSGDGRLSSSMLIPAIQFAANRLILFCLLLNTAMATVRQWHFEPGQHQTEESGQRKSHRGFKLLRLNPQTAAQLNWLHQLHQSDTMYLKPPYYQLDFWQPPSQPGALVDLTVAPHDAPAFFDELKRRTIDYLVMADDLEELIERERINSVQPEVGLRDDEFTLGKSGEKEPEYRYDRYNPLSRIEEQLFRLREQNPRILTLFEIGKSHENRSIVTAKVSARERSSDERWHPFRGPAVWIDAGIHAREWIAPATAMLLLYKLVNGYNTADAGIRYLVESIDWYITPVVNPDGYEYSHTKNRMWRKNRRPAFCKQQYFNRICCSGVDLNRNFDWFWSITGSSSDPCHETYHGPSAFSEPESRAVRDFLEEHPVKAFITLHSYSQLWLIPYGHKRRNYPEDYHTVQRPLSLRAVKALQRLYGTEYQVGSGADLLYEASGSSHDFAKGAMNIPFSFLVELRPQNTLHSTGFLLPEAEIADTSDETWEAIRVVADKVLERFAPLTEGRRNWKGPTSNSTPVYTTTPLSIKSSSSQEESENKTQTTTNTKIATAKTKIPLSSTPKTTIKATTMRTTTASRTTIWRSTQPTQTVTQKHTFLPNTITPGDGNSASSSTPSVLTSKTLPVATTLEPPLSVRRNNVKTGSSRVAKPPPEEVSGSSIEGGESAPNARRTIVNVKICTGGLAKGLPLPTDGSSQEEEEEVGEEIEEGPERGRPPIPAEITAAGSRRLVKCRDWSSYCKWWRMHSLCGDPRVRKLCTLSCMIECQI